MIINVYRHCEVRSNPCAERGRLCICRAEIASYLAMTGFYFGMRAVVPPTQSKSLL